ncbi:5227_t:CDS:2, partial [Cetraspora pellucida]
RRVELQSIYEGVSNLRGKPDVLFIIGLNKEKTAYSEAIKTKTPVIAVCNSNCDPKLVDYVILGNDEKSESINFFASLVADAIIQAKDKAKLVSENKPHNNKLNYLAIADYYPYEITEFLNLCKVKKIKPIWGVKIFLQEKSAGKKIPATIYPQNNKGYKEIIQKLFAPDSPHDRTFSPAYIFPIFSKNCSLVNYENIFLGFNFFLLAPSQTIPSQIIPRLLPFFAVKCLTFEEVKLLGEKLSEAKKESALLLLKSKCWQRLIALKKEKEEKYQQTLTEELRVITQLNYADYFLIFSDVVHHLKTENIIVGPGRGSAVASLVAYLLGITQIDPLEHKLFFARFLNEKRKSLPDIDLDVENQDEVFNYLQKKYPKKQVARIITRKKIDEIKLKEITSLAGESPDFIVISTNSLVGSVPLKTEKDYLLTLFEENKLAELGLKKYDFLSLRETLGFIREARSILSISLPDYQEAFFYGFQIKGPDINRVEVDNLLNNQAAIFRYLSIRKRLVAANNNLPFLHLSNEVSTQQKSVINKALINQREFESLGLYVSYFSRWKELAAQDHKICSLSAVLQKIEEYDNKETSLSVYAIICNLEKKSEMRVAYYEHSQIHSIVRDQNDYTVFLQDIRNSFQLNISSGFYQENKESLVIHNELLFTLKIGIKRGKINSLVCEGVKIKI